MHVLQLHKVMSSYQNDTIFKYQKWKDTRFKKRRTQ